MFRGQYCLLESHRPEGIQKAIDDFQHGNKESPIAKTKTFLNMFVRYKHLTNSTFKLGVCVPSKCSVEDLESILGTESMQFAGKITVSYCKQKGQEETSVEQIVLLCLLGLVLAVMIIGTVVDIVMRLRHDDNQSKAAPDHKNYYIQMIRNASLYTNSLEVLSTKKVHEPIKCLCGIRTITVMLTIYSHTYGHLHLLHFQKFSKAANFLKFFDSFTFSGIANGSVGMDTVAFVAGITITYTRWRYLTEKSKVNLNIWKLLLHRYCRMSAAQLLTICIFLTFPVFGSGPFWEAYMNPMLKNCRERWWLNILYINNFFQSVDVCLYHTWILAVIMQLTVLSVVIIWILKKSARYGIFCMFAIILAGIIGVAVITVINELPGSMAFFMLDFRTAPITWRDVYTLPYDHMGPFCIGLLAGYFLALKKDQLEINRTTSVILWCSSIACNSAVMFGLYSYRHGDKMDLSLSAFYAVMHRNVWALGIGWLIFACATKHGGVVTRVLESRIFLPLDRLCYMAFLLHIPIMFYHSGILRERWFMGHTELLFMAIGYIVISFFLSFLLHIIFVQPYYAIEEKIWSCFQPSDKVTFESNTNLRTVGTIQVIGSSTDTPTAKNECINLAYSKTLDGL
ncbi:Nose resistant to fluoxetine protein 6, partial [Stegodyphus mimosarum]